MNVLNKFKFSLVALALGAGFSATAETVAITNTTVYTGTEQGVISDANIVIEDGKIIAINPSNLEVDRTIDGQGRIVTPGFIAAMSQLGLVEVGAVSTSRDSSAKKGGITFDPSMAFNPESSLIPFARKGGITHSIVSPRGGDDIFSGTAFVADLSGEYDSVVETELAVVANFGAESKDSRASSLLSLISKLEAQQKKLDTAKEDDKKAKEPSAEEKLLTSLLKGEKPLVASASRATDILHLLKIKADFGLNLVLAWSKDAAKVKAQIAEAEVPVIVGAMDNLPGNFDSMHASLDTAGELEKAGVKVLLAVNDSHMILNLRYDAGNAAANGMSKEGAIASVSSNIAEVFKLEELGQVAEGKTANLVLWSADPFEYSTKVESLWIDGEEVSTESRQDKLRDRYTSKEQKRRGYIK